MTTTNIYEKVLYSVQNLYNENDTHLKKNVKIDSSSHPEWE